MNAVRVVGVLDRSFAWDGVRMYEDADLGPDAELPLELRGAAASVRSGNAGRWRIVRDPLGINKLFWVDAGGTVSLASRPSRLTQEGHDFDAIRAIPRGFVVDLDPSEGSAAQHAIALDGLRAPNDGHDDRIDFIARQIRSAVSGYLAAIASAHPRARAFVCLSGGLDSSSIAALAQEHFHGLTAVSFDLDRNRGQASEDRLVAVRLARDLGLPLLEATISEEQLLEHVDTALVEGIDWRDFNVHAALVNAALGEAIADAVRGEDERKPVLVFTGDLANEFLADYEPERYRGSTYYGLPKLTRPALRRILVRGLDTSHREIGVFDAWGLSAVQPYAAAVDAYLALPDAFVSNPDCKVLLCREMLGTRLPRYVYARRKARAQVGGPNAGGGVLGLCVDRGFDSAQLKRRFAELHGVTDLSVLDQFIRTGLYRSAVPSTIGIADGRS
jgi:asparagine synthetase B (glutamine-hydrolysing)